MFERYADDAKRAVYFAHIEALHRKEPAISVRDLLVGLTYDTETACKIAPLKKEAVPLRSRVGIPHLPNTSRPYGQGPAIPLDNDAKKAIAYATKEANLDRQYWIDSGHLLRGLLRFPNSAEEALLTANIHLESLRSASAQYRKDFPPAPTPKWAGLKGAVSKYWFASFIAIILLVIFVYLKSQG